MIDRVEFLEARLGDQLIEVRETLDALARLGGRGSPPKGWCIGDTSRYIETALSAARVELAMAGSSSGRALMKLLPDLRAAVVGLEGAQRGWERYRRAKSDGVWA